MVERHHRGAMLDAELSSVGKIMGRKPHYLAALGR
jgi:hypothetical protein